MVVGLVLLLGDRRALGQICHTSLNFKFWLTLSFAKKTFVLFRMVPLVNEKDAPDHGTRSVFDGFS